MVDFLKNTFRGDGVVWFVFVVLCIFSSVIMFSASSALAMRQAHFYSPVMSHITFLLFSFVIVFIIHRIRFNNPKVVSLEVLFYAISIFTLVYVLFKGNTTNSATRWMSFAGIQFQPSEVAKYFVIFLLARNLSIFTSGGKQLELKQYLICLAIVLVPCLLVTIENLSTGILYGVIGLVMLIYGGAKWKHIGVTAGVFILIALIFFLIAPYLPKSGPLHRATTWTSRIENFVNGSDEEDGKELTLKDIDGPNCQKYRAKIAIANSNYIGVGFGNSMERDTLPQAFSDFVFAIVIEECGIIGALTLMFFYLVFYFRAGRIVAHCKSLFGGLLVLGLSTMIIIQALANMAVAVGIIPVTGQTLPMISRGGSSLIMFGVYFGSILSVSYFDNDNNGDAKPKEKKPEKKK